MGYVKVIKSSPYYSRYQVRQDGVLGGGRGRRARRRRGKGGRQSTRRRWAAAGGRPARRGSPAHARRPRPPGMPGGDGRAWLPAGRVAPAKTVRAAAADGVLWGQARPPPRPRARDAPLVSTGTAARGHCSSRRRPGRDRTWDSVPAFWQWDGSGMAFCSRAGAALPSPSTPPASDRRRKGGRRRRRQSPAFSNFPRSHTTTPPPLTPSHRSSTGVAARARPTTGPASG
jgi:hypothetical protein